MPLSLEAMAASALASLDSPDAYRRLVEAVRAAWGAERALLARRTQAGTEVVSAVPSAIESDAGALAGAFGGDATALVDRGAEGKMLALRFGPRRGMEWCLALVGRAKAWTAAEQRALAEVKPHLELALDYARLRAELVEAHDREAAAAEDHERFLNVISHELRNPLAPILMWTSTLRRLRAGDADVLRATQAIAHAVGLERRLIEELLDLSRLDRGVLRMVDEALDLREVVGRVLDARRPEIEKAELRVAADLPDAPVPVRGDAGRLDQAVGALVENAVKFAPTQAAVAIRLAAAGRHARLSVSDTGPGLPPEIVPRLFQPFVQGPNARGGLGLGLALARRLVVLHGGTLEPSDVPGGTTFVVTLPLADGVPS
jgi:signal transduction histidine kinase